MAYDEKLAKRVEALFFEMEDVAVRKMFGGLCYLHRGNMVLGLLNDDLIARVGKAQYEEALKRKHTRPFDYNGKPMSGWVFVSKEGVKTKAALKRWLDFAREFTDTLAAK